MKKVMRIKKKTEASTGSITVEDLERMGEEEVREQLRDFLRDKKYLVVMDDVWTIDVWREIHQVFPNGSNGSRILLTTRNIDVARHAEPWIPPHELHLLDDTQSLELFRRKAFPPNDQDIPGELKELAQQLAKGCRGLPLALVVLGGLLSRKERSHHTWLKVAQSTNWLSRGEGQECLSILGLSYNDLPYQLKPCFLYITAFPEDSIISASKLVRLWIAEGFILQEQGQTMEDTARDWLDELVQRCTIQVVERSVAHGRVKSVRIHDMLRDFGKSEAGKDGFLHVSSSYNMEIAHGTSSYRAAFHNHLIKNISNSSPHLRTLLGFNVWMWDHGRFLNGLRVLDLKGLFILEELPKQIGNMIHLRYLGLRMTGLKRLPSSVGHLLNLQTLDVRDTDITWLPKSFWKIQTLRHVYVSTLNLAGTTASADHNNLQALRVSMPYLFMNPMDRIYLFTFGSIRLIKNWVTTSGFTNEAIDEQLRRIIGQSVGQSLGKLLEKMDSLVSLSLDWSLLSSLVGVIFARAQHLQKLRSLYLEGWFEPEQLPDSSQFPPNLTKLVLRRSYLKQDPMLELGKLSNLRLLKLDYRAYRGESMLCSSGGFPLLQHLILHNLEYLKEWRVEERAMPSLIHLTIVSCRKLKMLPEGLQYVTTLRELKLIEMPREFNDKVRNEDAYKNQRIPSIIFENEVS